MSIPVFAIDMDGVTCQYVHEVFRRWNELHPDTPLHPDKVTHDFEKVYPEQFYNGLKEIMASEDLFHNLPPEPGCLEALDKIRWAASTGKCEAFICTSPPRGMPMGWAGKAHWIIQNLGPWWMNHTMMVYDKTRANATYLIDDNPDPVNYHRAPWELIVFDQPWNQVEHHPHLFDCRRLKGWDNFRFEDFL